MKSAVTLLLVAVAAVFLLLRGPQPGSTLPRPAESLANQRVEPAEAEHTATDSVEDTPDPARATTQVYYQYIDDRGAVRFAPSLEAVPEAWRAKAGRIEMQGPPPTTPSEARAARARRTEMSASYASARGPNVVLYTTKWCPACKKALAYFDAKRVAYTNLDIEASPAAEREFLQKSGGRRGIPLIDVDGQIMQGFSAARLDAFLARAR